MSINSQYMFFPPQPDNPSDSERHFLLYHALSGKGWPEDLNVIKNIMMPPPDISYYAKPGQYKGKTIGIIGGGLAGLSAAYELRKLGFEITILDALSDRVGGRVYTYYFNGQKELYHEFGPMRIPVSHETVWHYLKLFKLPTKPFIQYNPNGYVYLKNTRVRNDYNGYNVMRYIYPKYKLNGWEKQLNWQKLISIGTDNHLLNVTPAERSEIIKVLPSYLQKTLYWDAKMSISIMESSNLSQEAISLISNFIPLLYGNLYNSFIDYIQESYPANLNYLYEIPGGMAKLPASFYNSFNNPAPYEGIPGDTLGKVNYKASCWVNDIGLDGNKVKIGYQYNKENRKKEELFDYVVCTIPFSTLRSVNINPLFSNIKMRAIREVNYTPSQKSLLLFKERFWEREGIIGGASFTDMPVASIWYPSDHSIYLNNSDSIKNIPWNKPGVIIGSFNFNLDTTRLTNQPEYKLLNEIKKEIGMIHGLSYEYLDKITEGFKSINWNQEPTFRGALSFFSPEQKRIFSYGMAQSEYNGRIFFAGEHISAVHRWMQGALQTGMQAANDLAVSIREQIR